MFSRDLMCSICLEVFSDPVSTPCGHNFCKICLSTYWNNSQDCRCPNCKETFKQRPDLKINTTLRDVVDEHKKKCHEEQAEVVCDICSEGKLKAVKSCLVCQSSYCETHLEPHLRVSGLQKHKLIDPVKNLQDYICQKHDRPLELFCRDDHTSVCLSCADGDHKNHNTVPITESELQEMMEEKQKEITEMKRNIKLQMIAEKQRAAETRDKCLINDLKKEITEIQWRNNELEMVKQKQITAENVIKVRDQEITELKKRNTELVMFDLRPGLFQPKIKCRASIYFQTLAFYPQRPTAIHRISQLDVTLDPDTAHPELILSDDEKQVRHGDIRHKLPDNPKRFDTCVNVLGKEGFSSGRFYYEVQVKGKTQWTLGVVRESVDRKGEIALTPVKGFWTVWLRNKNEYKACADPPVSLSLRVKPQKVGVFVDYEEGLVSFYDVDNRSHIYSYTDQSFTEKL
ncbi:putative E3 ubiquitin-protein ligase TRIM39 [Triplophysa rosa]|uniref:E3 ubiquitin-protein ligase TRIM39 n=1 Tax=Triplophysa rosa TaxID=992332 RepID=A0A9W7TLM5_TRIRA|nr:putative E3 ubiquitin-protein ligase TRIM39 [Triplophysa rosa]